jgi:hypothetical protein
MIVTRENFPELRAAFQLIEVDNGGHLIGTVYPGERINFEAFSIPDFWAHLAPAAEAALARLRACGKADLETFVIGEVTEQEAIVVRQGDLAEAHTLLNDWFNGWQPEDAPGAGASV